MRKSVALRTGAVAVALFCGLAAVDVRGVGAGTTRSTDAPVRTLHSGCSAGAPCHFPAGIYRLGSGTVLPGLRLTLEKGWSSSEDWYGSLRFNLDNAPRTGFSIWLDVTAVKSSGRGHGTTPLPSVGTTPSALTSWLIHNRDFLIVSKPVALNIGGAKATTLAVSVSHSARYGDPGCPANPRCADLFTSPTWSDFFGIGGEEEVRLYLATIKTKGQAHTLVLSLDAPNHEQLLHLQAAASPTIRGLHLP